MPTLRSLARSLLLASLVLAASLASAWTPRAWGEDAATLEFPDTPLVERTVKGATVQAPRHDFGVVAQQAEVTATIPYRNAGTTAVEGLRVKSGCSCFGATLSERTLAPGATGTLTVRLRSGSMKGTVEKPLRLLYREGQAQAMVELRIRAKVIAGVLVERVWFGEIRA
ncbi:MAG: DUF1573 domain-containing protein, partial [Planctomycetota bacterium]|nr:DUF1573 domain-containing protein [Planctomycetota bacterium]